MKRLISLLAFSRPQQAAPEMLSRIGRPWCW